MHHGVTWSVITGYIVPKMKITVHNIYELKSDGNYCVQTHASQKYLFLYATKQIHQLFKFGNTKLIQIYVEFLMEVEIF